MDTTFDTTESGSAARPHGPVPRELDQLLALDHDALEALYRDARVPAIEAIRGDLRGRMLAIPALPRALVGPIRAFAGSSVFPWLGKSFAPRDRERGDGINRVFVDRNKWFRFETFVGPSRAGDFDAVQLDYDNRDNPFFIRAIKDEIREIAPGLYLGQAYAQVRGRATLVLWFALQQR